MENAFKAVNETANHEENNNNTTKYFNKHRIVIKHLDNN